VKDDGAEVLQIHGDDEDYNQNVEDAYSMVKTAEEI